MGMVESCYIIISHTILLSYWSSSGSSDSNGSLTVTQSHMSAKVKHWSLSTDGKSDEPWSTGNAKEDGCQKGEAQQKKEYFSRDLKGN